MKSFPYLPRKNVSGDFFTLKQYKKNPAALPQQDFLLLRETKLLGSIFGVQQVMSLFAAGSSEILFVEFLDIFVLVRETQSFTGILGIEC